MFRQTTASFAGALLLLGAGSGALAQSPARGTTTPYESLSPGNQKIANALFEAQLGTPSNGTTGTSGTTTMSTPLTLDEIAAKKQSGQGWGLVFEDMKAQGLVQEKNLGQIVSKYTRPHNPPHSTSGGSTITTASGRQYPYKSGSSSHYESGHQQRGHGRYGERGKSGEYTASGKSTQYGKVSRYGHSGNQGSVGGHGKGKAGGK